MDKFYDEPIEQPKVINYNVNICVVCGKVIPEGSQICTYCKNEGE